MCVYIHIIRDLLHIDDERAGTVHSCLPGLYANRRMVDR